VSTRTLGVCRHATGTRMSKQQQQQRQHVSTQRRTPRPTGTADDACMCVIAAHARCRCIRLLRWHTDSGRSVVAGSPGSGDGVQLATAAPQGGSGWQLVSVRGTYGTGEAVAAALSGCAGCAPARLPGQQAGMC
jgi:hypothetical protein